MCDKRQMGLTQVNATGDRVGYPLQVSNAKDAPQCLTASAPLSIA